MKLPNKIFSKLQLIKVSLLLILLISFITRGQSDNPCGAPSLPVNSNCTFQVGSIPSNATATPSIPAPGCASYSGSDVWYQATVPASGTLSIDLNPVSITDAGMAWYSASSCNGPFTLLECDDDDSNNGLMPKITQYNLTPGQIIYVRVWRYSGGTGSFQICASSPTPPTPCIGGGNASCTAAQGFCTNNPAVTYCNISSSNLGSYDCLGSTPNAMWLYMKVAAAGAINIDIAQYSNAGNPIDVDFALYGPYTSVPVGCPVIGPNTATVDCSYSASATEQANIPNAQVGQVYIMLVTNFNGSAGSIQFSNGAGTTGQTDCNVIYPCSIGTSSTTATCSQPTGSVSAINPSGTAPYTYSWNTPGNPTTANVNNLPPGTYQVTMTTDDGCTSSANVTVSDQLASYTWTSTPTTCAGFTDGTATINTSTTYGTVSYLWDDPAGQTTQTATGLAAGQYNCTVTTSAGCSDVITVTVDQLPGLQANITSQSDVTCNSGNDGIIQVTASQGTQPYSYAWDNSASITNIANDLAAGAHVVRITDANGCYIDVNGTISEPAPLDITFITPTLQICPEHDTVLAVLGSGGSSQYTFTWYENGNMIGTGDTIRVDPEYTNTQYCVTLSEACGSPVDDECTIINFPTPIVPLATPDEISKCVPDTFYFENSSTNAAEIATTYWEFNNYPTHNELINGSDSISHFFDIVGPHTVTMTITSIYGCVYSDTLVNIIDVKPSPTADFTFSSNPTTFFETRVLLQDASSSDVTYWEWYSPGSIPMTGNQENLSVEFPEGVADTYPVYLYVETDQGCFDSIMYTMTVIEDVIFYAPNAFTPDGDEHNQIWKPIINGIDIYDFELLIFNRWGELIWENHDPSVGWDGTYKGQVLPAGGYTWVARVKKPLNDGKETFSGTINLLR